MDVDIANAPSTVEVRKAIRRFRDYSNDLLRSNFDTFEDRLQMLMRFCEDDLVFKQLHKQLVDYPAVDFDAWAKVNFDPLNARRTGLRFPQDLDQRVALQYQLLCAGAEKPRVLINYSRFWFHLSTSRMSDYIAAFAETVMEPLFRELGYRLESIEENLPSDPKEFVAAGSLSIIHVASADIRAETKQTFNIHSSQGIQIGDHNSQSLDMALREIVLLIDRSDATPEKKAEAREIFAKTFQNETMKNVLGPVAEAASKTFISPT